MISGKTMALAALSALALCGAMAQSASAAFEPATDTTAFTCVQEGGEEDFTDAHCDYYAGEANGEYGHVAIASGEPTDITITNENTASSTTASTPAILHSTLAGVSVTLEATEVHGEGYIENEGSEGEHQVTGHVTVKYTNIHVSGVPNCEVAEVILAAKFEGVNQGGEMGLNFSPTEGTTFAEIPFSGEGCAFNGFTFKVKGSMIATGGTGPTAQNSGATTVFEPGNGMESLTLGGSAATFESTVTAEMKEGNPIALTSTEGTPTEDPSTSGATAFACEQGAGAEDFADPHCDEAVSAETGEYGHKAISSGEETEIELTNAQTENDTTDSADAILEASVVGIEAKIAATKVSGTGFLENVAPVEGHHSVKGEVTMQYANLHVEEPSNCEVASPIEFTAAFESYEEGEAMGIELTPKEGTTFVSIEFEGEECALDGITAKVKGSARAIGGAGATAEGSGATLVLEPANESLAVGKGAASIASTATVRMKEGPPLSLTTVK